MSSIDLYVFAERSIFETDADWLAALSTLARTPLTGLAVQVRTRSETPERSRALAEQAREATRDAAIPVLLNGTSDEARSLGYDGAHWPEALIPDAPETAQDSDPPATPFLRGASVHSPEACRRAENAGADLVVAGTVFDAGSKPVAGSGLEALGRIARAARLPVLAIGGVTPARVSSCIDAGASGVAVVTSVLRATDMTVAVQALREALDEAKAAPTPQGRRDGSRGA